MTLALSAVNHVLYPESQNWPTESRDLYWSPGKWWASRAAVGILVYGSRDCSLEVMVAPVGVPHSFGDSVAWRSWDGASSRSVCVEQPESSTACCC